MSSRAFGKSLTLAAAFATLVLAVPTPLAPRNNLSWVSPEYYWIFQYPLPIPPIKTTTTTWTNSSTGAVIDFYEVSIQSFEQQIYPNLPKTKLVGYDGMSPGPTFEMQKGIAIWGDMHAEAVARFSNNSPRETSVHVHGQYSRSPFDGWAADTSQPGQYKDYYYPNGQNARTLWYHDHAEFITAENVYEGLAGFYIINDSEEGSFGLPSGNYDIPLALSSKQYDNNGQLVSDTNDNNGLWGDIIHVNGQPWPYLCVEPRKYRLRLLDASVSRTYALYFESDDGSDISFNVVASDSGFLSHPVETSTLNLAMGERYEIVFDFSSFSGKNVTLRNTQGVGQNIDYAATDKVMQFVVGNTVSSKNNNGDLPSTLRVVPFPPDKTEADKDFEFARVGDEWKINGVGFADINARILTKPPRGAVEIWNLKNGAGGGVHPVHIHLIDFEILSRTGDNGSVLPYEAAGLKDVVYLGPGQSIQVIARYAPWDGVYMFHCHDLVHEDHDMLVGFNVTSLAKWGYPPSTHFINPMEPEFAPKAITASDFTQDAIERKLAWFYSTDAYGHGEEDAVESTLEAYWSTATDEGYAAVTTAAATLTQTASSSFATHREQAMK